MVVAAVVLVVGPVPIVVVVVPTAVVVVVGVADVVVVGAAVVVVVGAAVELVVVVDAAVVVVVVVVVVTNAQLVSQLAEPDGPSSQSSSIPGSPFGAWVTKSPQNVKVHGPLLFAGSELLVHSLSATSPPLSHCSSPSTSPSPQTGPAYALNDSPADKNRGNSKDRDLRFDMVRFLKLVICVLMFEIIDISLGNLY